MSRSDPTQALAGAAGTEALASRAGSKLSRRTLFAGVGTVGALAAAASLLPGAQQVTDAPEPTRREPPERGGGYALSEHVKRYYRTTRL
ncbi:MAG: formate dehydrogenase [Ramlibacter sp.]